jgi:urease accessory protein|tara:strand:- start:23394 stop:24074 length:681 start_codon:yes stop_codon:yes gene_type:complete
MSEHIDILRSLQHSDSFFPAGATAMSAGLETLVDEGRISSSPEVEEHLHGQLNCRWAEFDRPVLVAAYCAGDDHGRVAEIDAQVEAQTLATESRTGSQRAGRSLLGVHVKMGTTNAFKYQAMIGRATAYGHNSVIQGLVWRATGISELTAQAMSAHIFCIGLVSAALRLGVIGHISAQEIVSNAHDLIDQILVLDATDLEHISSFAPEQEIAVMRHESMSYRLFVN